ncbi:cell division protein FtsL [Consotaella aegiceratis]|uniref:cell division protein FtsL n=1 Tax=Consotaella aegiceratis TaxID=3097961 RepID=UPI002F3F3E2B
MLRTLDIVLIAVMISAAAWTYKIKHEAEAVEEHLDAVQHQIGQERDTIALLEADWSLLNQPDRLQRLVETYSADLGLEPMRPDQIVEPDELPAQPINLIPNPNDVLGGYADSSESVVR